MRDSVISAFGSECFQVKENAHHNLMQRVECRANDEPLAFSGSNVELRGDHNTVEDSVLAGSRGVNLKIASDEPRRDSARPPGPACGNTFATPLITAEGHAFARASEPCPR